MTLISLGLWGCSEARGPFRTTPLSDPQCAEMQDLTGLNQEIGREALRRCPLQMQLLPGASAARAALAEAQAEAAEESGGAVVPGLPGNDWTVMAAEAGRALYQSDDYHLAFVELSDAGDYDLPDQIAALGAHLRRERGAGRQNVVVAYVHGWRHNAQLRDGDIRKFRRMLAYSRAALNSRCIVRGDYCNATLTGAFIGWNGQRVKEGPSDENPDAGMGEGLASLAPALTFWDRWNISCRLGGGRRDCAGRVPKDFRSPLRRTLTAVEARLRLRQGDARADKLMVVGHSMGGNMLASMLRDEVVRDVARHGPGQAMKPVLGDLVVLINPAARSEEWTAIQKAERARAGLGESRALTCLDEAGKPGGQCAESAALIRWHRLYPVNQRPTYISLTSAADWGTLREKDREVQHDTATGQIFPFAREFIGETGAEQVVAIGHRTPDYASRFTLNGPALGTSHEIAVLEGAQTDGGRRYASHYGNAVKAEAGWCEPADGWLLRARHPDWAPPGGFATNWDYGLAQVAPGAPPISSRNVGGRASKAAVQWRQGMYLKSHTGALSVSPGTTPFWNVRALDSAIRGHAGWANYATWCALSQLVLDDVTAPDPETIPPGEAEAKAVAMELTAGQ